MNEDNIRQSMSDDERAKFASGAEALDKLQEGSAFDAWLPVGEGLLAIRAAVMRVLHLRKPSGRYYPVALSNARADSAYAGMENDECSNLLYCMDNLEAIQKMRADWEPQERARVCHPDTMRKRYRALLKAVGEPEDKPERASPMAVLKEQYIEACDKIARLQDVVDKGSTFSARDTYKDLAQFLADRIIDSRLSRGKALKMLKRAEEILKARWAKEDEEFSERKAGDDEQRGEATPG